MMDTEFCFEQSPWEQELERLGPGAVMPAARLLTLLEGEEEESVQEALDALEEARITLDARELPPCTLSGELAARLALEARWVQQGANPGGLEDNDPLRLYLEELAGIPAAGDPRVLAMELAQGDESAVTKLTNLMLSLVVHKAFPLAGRGVLLVDLIQEGSLGLWQGLLHYTGGDIETHCAWWIDQYLARALLLQARAAGVGQRLRGAMEDYRDVDQRLLAELGRNATLEEIAQQLHMPLQETALVADMIRTAQAARQMKPREEPEQELSAEDDQAVEDTAYFQSRQRILEMLSTLSPQEAQLLTLRFGLEGGLPLDPRQTGAKMGLTDREVVEMEAAALAKLRGRKD